MDTEQTEPLDLSSKQLAVEPLVSLSCAAQTTRCPLFLSALSDHHLYEKLVASRAGKQSDNHIERRRHTKKG